MAKEGKEKRKGGCFTRIILAIVFFAAGWYAHQYFQAAEFIKAIAETVQQGVENENVTPTTAPENSESSTTQTSDDTSTESTQATAETNENGVTITFKESMDTYEAFFDDYYDFLVKYSQANDTTTMLADYADFMLKYADTMAAIDAIDEATLSAADDAYFIEVHARILEKAAEANALIAQTNQ